MRVGVGALLLVVGMTTGCKRSSQVGTGTGTGTGMATATAAPTVASASAKVASRPVAQRTCKLGAPVVANEGRGGITHGIAASAAGVVVTWGELRRPTAGFGPDDAKQRYEMARVFELDTLAARGPAQEIGRQEAVDAFTNGIAPFALDDGTLGTGTCAWAAFAGKLSCGLAAVAPSGAKLASGSYVDPGVAGPGPEGDRVAAAGIGDAAIMLMPQCQDVRIVASAAKAGVRPLAYGSAEALAGCEPKKTIDVPAIATVSANEVAGVWRHGAAIEGRLIGKDGMPHGGIVGVSAPGGDVGAPAITWAGDHALVTWAARTGSAPYALAFAHWKLGAPITRAKLDTGAAPAMAPALAPTDEAGCVMIAWTEGKGDATHVRAGLACGDALVAASVIDVSAGGIEAGDSELARVAASTGYVVWQELPKGKPAELRVAKISCE